MEHIETGQPEKKEKFYSSGWIFLGTYIGGPLAGAYFLGKNYVVLGRKDLFAKSMQFGVGATLLGVLVLIMVPDSVIDTIPTSIIPLLYTLLIGYLFNTYQKKDIDVLIKDGHKKQSGFKVFGLAMMWLLISFGMFLAVAFILPEGLLGM